MPERYAGAIIVGLDVHLRQITFDCLDSATGEVTRGRITPTPAAVQERVAQFPGREVHVAMEACTGWLHQLERFDSHDLRGSGRRRLRHAGLRRSEPPGSLVSAEAQRLAMVHSGRAAAANIAPNAALSASWGPSGSEAITG
jgi:hypothetical protein